MEKIARRAYRMVDCEKEDSVCFACGNILHSKHYEWMMIDVNVDGRIVRQFCRACVDAVRIPLDVKMVGI